MDNRLPIWLRISFANGGSNPIRSQSIMIIFSWSSAKTKAVASNGDSMPVAPSVRRIAPSIRNPSGGVISILATPAVREFFNIAIASQMS